MFMMEPIKFIQVTFLGGTKGYVRADTIVELFESSEGKTYVYIMNSGQPIFVRESVGEILAKMGATVWNKEG